MKIENINDNSIDTHEMEAGLKKNTYCHTRPGVKTYPIPKGSKDGLKRGIIFVSDQPANRKRLSFQHIQIGISHQPLVGSYSNFELKRR